MVTHHLADILPEIDRVVMMKGGRIFADGPKTELLQAEKLEDPERIGVLALDERPEHVAAAAQHREQLRGGTAATSGISVVEHRAAAIDLFSELTPGVELPSTSQPLLRDAG